MKKVCLVFFLLVFGCNGPKDFNQSIIKEIIVLDTNFKQVNLIKDSIQISEIKAIIANSDKIINLPEKLNWNYKIDIKSNVNFGRWLYDSTGILSKLNYQLKPSYKIKDNRKLNALFKK